MQIRDDLTHLVRDGCIRRSAVTILMDQGGGNLLSFVKPRAILTMAPSMTSAEQPDVPPIVGLPGGLLRYGESLYDGASRLLAADLCPDDSTAIQGLLRTTLAVYHSGHGLSTDVTPVVMDLNDSLQVLPWFSRSLKTSHGKLAGSNSYVSTEIPCRVKTSLIYLNRQTLTTEDIHLLDELNSDNHTPSQFAYSELRYRTVTELTVSIRDDQEMPHHLEAIESLSLAHSRHDSTTSFFHHNFSDMWTVVDELALAIHRGQNDCSVSPPVPGKTERNCRCCGERLTAWPSFDTSKPMEHGHAHINASGERFDATTVQPLVHMGCTKVGPEHDTPESRGDTISGGADERLTVFREHDGMNGWASNWNSGKFEWAGRYFYSGQQALAYAKARMFGDTLAASDIQ